MFLKINVNINGEKWKKNIIFFYYIKSDEKKIYFRNTWKIEGIGQSKK